MSCFSALFYLVTILGYTKSYVLLAANMEDFRTLAKQFVPDSMADEILQMAKDAVERDKYKEHPELRTDQPDTTFPSDSYESEVAIRSKPSESASKNQTSIKYQLTLDELVDKVKQRLQSELSLMAATAGKKKVHQQLNHKLSTKPLPQHNTVNVEEAIQEYPNEKPQARYKKESNEQVENISHEIKPRNKKVKSQTPDTRYVAETFVAQPPQYLVNMGKPVALKPEDTPQREIHKVSKRLPPLKQRQVSNVENVKQIKKVRYNKRRITTTEGPNLFDRIDMMKPNDSYEDYVIPKKDDDYIEPETSAPKYKNVQQNPYIQRQLPSKKNKKVVEVFSVEYETTTKNKEYGNNEEENEDYENSKKITKHAIIRNKHIQYDNYNKQDLSHDEQEPYLEEQEADREIQQKIPIAEPLTGGDEERIQPYEEQLQDSENADETEQLFTTTEEPKARSEIISFNEFTTSHYQSQAQKNSKVKNKKKGKQRIATVIPKRDGYKMSSPNYLVKLPIVGEKYQFDEPIPESDRLREKIEPMKDTKSIINGKVVIL